MFYQYSVENVYQINIITSFWYDHFFLCKIQFI